MRLIGFGFALSLVLFAGCSKYYWEAPGRDVAAFQADSDLCIKDAVAKDRAAEAAGLQSAGKARIYRSCMTARGWQRVELPAASPNQFRGPEDDEHFTQPPSPLGGVRYSP